MPLYKTAREEHTGPLLKESHAVIIMAATLGIKTDRRLRALEISDMGKAYVYNACANAMIEAVCDDVK